MIRIRGFTLIELLVVVAVIGVLAGATIVLIDPSERMKQGSDFSEEQRMRNFAKAMEDYAVINGKYSYITCSGGVGGFNCASQAIVDSGSLKKPIASQENGYTLYYYSFDNMNSTSFDDGSPCGSSAETCARFLVYNTSTSFKSKGYKQKYGNGTSAYLIYDSKYQKVCGSATDPHLGRATNCDGT